MNDITIDDNYDELKEEFFKGLTFRQTVYGLLTILTGTAAFVVLGMVLKVPQMAAVYLAALAAIPVAANGFVTVYGMTILEFARHYQAIKKQKGYLYQSEEEPDWVMETLPAKKNGTGKKKETLHPTFLYQDLSGDIQGGGEVL